MEDLFIIIPNEPTIEEEEQVEKKKLIMKEPNELVAFKQDEISMQTTNFIAFVIKVEEIKIFLVEFELSSLGKSYLIQGALLNILEVISSVVQRKSTQVKQDL